MTAFLLATLTWAKANELVLGYLFSAIMSQMPVEDDTNLPFFPKWGYRALQVIAANLNHLQKKG